MKSIKYSLLLLSLVIFLHRCSSDNSIPVEELKEPDKIDFIDPLIGTAVATTISAQKHSVSGSELRGQNYPAVGVPHGMTQWTPQTQDTEQKCLPPYYYEDSVIRGFRGTHWMSGSCTQDYGSVTLMPMTGQLEVDALHRGSVFKRESEVAKPYSYRVFLDRYDIDIEISALSRTGILKIDFGNQNKDAYVVVEPNSDEGLGYVKIYPSQNIIVGYNPVHRIYQGWGASAGFKGYFVVQFSNPFISYGTWEKDQKFDGNMEVLGDSTAVGAYVQFNSKQKLIAKVGTSFTSMEEAMANLASEIPGWGLERVKEQSRELWVKALDKISVESDQPDLKDMFYTALYHSYLLPRTFSDADGSYVGFADDSTVHRAEHFTYYADFSMWDTYRSVHPLMTLLEPEKSSEMVQSLIAKAEQGGWLPIFPAWNNYTSAMIGDHVIAMIGDASAKGIEGFDQEKAWKFMSQNAFVFNKDRKTYVSGKGRRALDTYLRYNYLPMEEKVPDSFHQEEQVSRTLEYAYDDFVLAKFAKKLKKEEEYSLLIKRASNWKNVFDPSTGYVRGKYIDGSWFEPFNPNETRTPFITEGTPFQYTWYVPHDVYGLMDKMGGKDNFIHKLDALFDSGEYWHGNEPGHQTAYMYAYAGAPWKTQQRVSHIISEEYGIGPGGLSGNEDAGQMSAWLVFSMIGFYPVCPGTPYYIIGTPAFNKVSLNLGKDKKFEIIANKVSKENHFIQSASLNGQPFNKAWLSHEELINGGELVFEMGPKPNKAWAADVQDLPVNVMESF